MMIYEENGNAYAFATCDILVGEELVVDATVTKLPDEWRHYFMTGIGTMEHSTTSITSNDSKQSMQSPLSDLKEKIYVFTQTFAAFRHELRQFIQQHEQRNNSDDDDESDKDDIPDFADDTSLPFRFMTSYAKLLPILLQDSYTIFSLLLHVPKRIFKFYDEAWNHPTNGFRILQQKLFEIMTRTASVDFRQSFQLPEDVKRILE